MVWDVVQGFGCSWFVCSRCWWMIFMFWRFVSLNRFDILWLRNMMRLWCGCKVTMWWLR